MIFGKYVNKYYGKYFLFFLFGLLALLAVNWFQLEIPRICGEILDGIGEKAQNDPTSLFNNPEGIRRLMIELGIIALIMFVGRFLWRYCIFGVGARIEADVRNEMFTHSLKLSNAFYKHHKTGALMALFTNDLQVIRQAFGQGTVMAIDAIFLGSFALYRMFSTNWILSCFSIIPMVLIAIVSAIVGRILKEKFKVRQEAYEALSDFTQENFSGIAVVKAFVKEVHEIRHFDKINEENRAKNINYVKYATLLNILLTAIISSIFVLLFAGGAYFVLNGFMGEEFTVGNMWEFIGYFDAVVWPFMAVAQLINMRAQAKASLTRVNAFLDEKIEIVDDNVENVDQIRGKIEFRNLNFKYPDGSNAVLSNISLHIPQGTMVGIIGKTGCGKTTIVDLLLRTYNLEDGQIFIDDKDIMHIPYRKVREAIGYVPQDNFLFSDTISNNIAFAYEKLDEETIVSAAKLADVHNNILEFQDKYDTILGERGVTLSGGQKQRVSIARAIVKNPPILIFDDSVSAVDTKTEETILSNLRALREGKTTLMIAHRISTVKSLDLIVVMDEGAVVGVGTHDELIKSCSLYQEMVHLQSLEAEINGGEE
ncbi:MAG: ABC transporter ATP-binding protein/permease [Anaeroplasmataceae bacterium]|nr:ABC transporter ATP-binding protein/permease [Anaeroplasmataceae bacterium]